MFTKKGKKKFWRYSDIKSSNLSDCFEVRSADSPISLYYQIIRICGPAIECAIVKEFDFFRSKNNKHLVLIIKSLKLVSLSYWKISMFYLLCCLITTVAKISLLSREETILLKRLKQYKIAFIDCKWLLSKS